MCVLVKSEVLHSLHHMVMTLSDVSEKEDLCARMYVHVCTGVFVQLGVCRVCVTFIDGQWEMTP